MFLRDFSVVAKIEGCGCEDEIKAIAEKHVTACRENVVLFDEDKASWHRTS
jgi:hypothetical protein